MFQFEAKFKREIKRRLRESKTDFAFDQTAVKNKILSSIDNARPAKKLPSFAFQRRSWKFRLALGLGAVCIAVFSGTLVIADSAEPGDFLFFLDQLQEQMALKLPQSPESKTKLRATIVAERLTELQALPRDKAGQNVMLRSIIENQETLEEAVSEAAEIKVEAKDQAWVEKFNKIFTDLQTMAEHQEQTIQKFRDEFEDDARQKIEERLEAIKKTRIRAEQEMKNKIKIEDQIKGEQTNNENVIEKKEPEKKTVPGKK